MRLHVRIQDVLLNECHSAFSADVGLDGSAQFVGRHVRHQRLPLLEAQLTLEKEHY